MIFPAKTYVRRREQVRRLMSKSGWPALLVVSEHNIRWLTGFSGDSTWLLLTESVEVLISDFRYVTQIEEECPGVSAWIRPSTVPLTGAVNQVMAEQKVSRVGFESHILSVDLYRQLAKAIGEQNLIAASSPIEPLRAVKDAAEIAEIRKAVRLAERGFELFRALLRPELTERELSALLEQGLREFGAEGFSFPAIVAVGDRAALPHYRPGEIPISADPLVLLDWGARTPSGYVSDLTRVLITGKKDKQFEKVYRTVLDSQLAAIEAIAPGVTCGDVDAIARKHIADAGFGKYFDHGLGHGIGLQVHEAPRLSRNQETVLRPGMVVTVEPGIYLPGWGGVRIEDDVLVTRQGHDVLSSVPKGWDDLRVEL